MIQRIQSIYLFLAFLLGIIFLFVPGYHIANQLISGNENLALTIVAAIGAIISFGTIFLFKNRNLQSNIARLAMVVFLVLVILGVYLDYSDGSFQPNYGAVLPLLSIVFNLLAAQAILKDEHMVRDSERLR